ncbi:charged multivesicular body protein 1a-like [Octopus sinensis]|uniref:Charged multivesicular body protein 1a-like n=1 Tax=Octopus sinensis TaxID=2607531 RepID=A0A6P7U4V1_9MOLL|nr:charged multivesicular body protein 1a-like [Octopus sinensis]
MKGIGMSTKELDKVMKSMDLVKITKIMDNFTKQFENLDVMTSVFVFLFLLKTVSTNMDSSMATSTPQDQVSALMIRVAEENDLDVLGQLKAPKMRGDVELSKDESETLEARLLAVFDP